MRLRHTLNRAADSLAEALVHFWEAREKEKRTPVAGVGGGRGGGGWGAGRRFITENASCALKVHERFFPFGIPFEL